MIIQPVQQILDKLKNVQQQGKGHTSSCPAHDDKHNSLKIDEGDDGRVLLYCHAGCSTQQVITSLGLQMRDLFPEGSKQVAGGGGRVSIPPRTIAQAHTLEPEDDFNSCTLSRYAEAKGLPLEFLAKLSLSDFHYMGRPAVRIPYPDENGVVGSVRFRTALLKASEADNRFKWKGGSKVRPYGIWRLEDARKTGHITIVEGESDCHTLWYAGEPAIGIPGASNWKEGDWAPYFEGIDTIYLVVEPDKGGESLLDHISKSRIRDRVRLVNLGEAKDASGLYLQDRENFPAAWQSALAAAVPLIEVEQEQAEARATAAWLLCQDLATESDILGRFADELEQRGVVGERRNSQILYLAVTSRVLSRPVSVAVKGPSSAGKSFLVDRTLAYFPLSTYYALSAMSERALAYSEEPLKHRMLVVYEAAGMEGEFATYLMRSLLSEGKVRYETVEKTSNGIKARLIEREGPTGLIVTTTSARLHAENETRLLSILATDTREQTKRIMLALASHEPAALDPQELTEWHALQEWLQSGETEVEIPFGLALAQMASDTAVRLRRDFGMLLNLIRSHAVLHKATRNRDEQGRIVAELRDYQAVYELVADLIAEGVESTVSDNLRDTVQAVAEICHGVETASVQEIAKRLKLDRSAAQRRVSSCLDRNYLRNLEERKGPGHPQKLALGEPLPEQQQVLPTPEMLAERLETDNLCNCASVTGGVYTPPPSSRQALALTIFEEQEAIA